MTHLKLAHVLACMCLVISSHANLVIVTGNLTGEVMWNASNVYLLSGVVYVTNGATLTIEPGTIIMGERSTKGTLIVQRGGRLIADGMEGAPIVFTSDQIPGSRDQGDWGGLALCGWAPVNLPGGSGTVAGIGNAAYGGPNAGDDSGILRYVRIEFAGAFQAPNTRINGLCLAGIGHGTIIDHVQVSYSAGDAFEWFGGTVNARHLYAYAAMDDDFDMTNGYSGKLQFLVSQRVPALADITGSNGFEQDNDIGGNAVSPYTTPVISNVSLFGPKATAGTSISPLHKNALHLRWNARSRIFNSVFAGFPTGCLIDGSSTEANCDADLLKVKNNVFSGMGTVTATAMGSSWNVAGWFANSGNVSYPENLQLEYTDPFNLTSPGFTLLPSSPLNNGAAFTESDLDDPFFQIVNYRGAFGATDWTQGWSNKDPQNTSYNVGIDEPGRSIFHGLWPNPNDGSFTVHLRTELERNATMQVMDGTGRVVWQGVPRPGIQQIDLPEVPSGMYVLQVRQQGIAHSMPIAVL